MKNDCGNERALGSSSDAPYSHIESLLRALHQPNFNVARPATGPSTSVLKIIEEQTEEVLNAIDGSPMNSSGLPPVLFDIESVSETSSNPPSPVPSSPNIQDTSEEAPNGMPAKKETGTSVARTLENNLERFNKNVLNVMDTMMKSRTDSPMHLQASASTGKPFVFHRMHRHNSAHSLNIPNIVVTGSDPQHQPHKRFTFGLRRHSHAVVGSVATTMCVLTGTV